MRVYMFVGAAGMTGALLRYYVSILFDFGGITGFPMGTFLANMVGSFALGLFTTSIVALKKLQPHLLKAIGTGLIGSFTTFSTFSVETVELMRQGLVGIAFPYVLFSLAGGLLLSGCGYYMGKVLYRKGGTP